MLLLKYCFRSVLNGILNLNANNGWSRLIVPFFRTKFSQNSLDFRAIKLWNQLPRAWQIDGLTFSKFVENCKELIRTKRNQTTIFY
jgi:hypothetical protein